MSSQARLATNHGYFGLPTFINDGDALDESQDREFLADNRNPKFYLSSLPSSSTVDDTVGTVIPGMQEIFNKLASRPHASPILAATLSKFSNQVDPSGTNLIFSRSAFGVEVHGKIHPQKNSSSFDGSTSSSIDFTDFPQSPISGALADLHSLNYDSLNMHCSASCNGELSINNGALDVSVDEVNCMRSCTPNLEDEESDLVPSELIQFVSESTRQIPGDLVDVSSVGGSDIEEMDHEARLASLCVPILHPPSLIPTQLPDSAQPPALSPGPAACSTLSCDHTDSSVEPDFSRVYFTSSPNSKQSDIDERRFDSEHLSSPTHFSTSDDFISNPQAMFHKRLPDFHSPIHMPSNATSESTNISNVSPHLSSESYILNVHEHQEQGLQRAKVDIAERNSISMDNLTKFSCASKLSLPQFLGSGSKESSKVNFMPPSVPSQLVLKLPEDNADIPLSSTEAFPDFNCVLSNSTTFRNDGNVPVITYRADYGQSPSAVSSIMNGIDSTCPTHNDYGDQLLFDPEHEEMEKLASDASNSNNCGPAASSTFDVPQACESHSATSEEQNGYESLVQSSSIRPIALSEVTDSSMRIPLLSINGQNSSPILIHESTTNGGSSNALKKLILSSDISTQSANNSAADYHFISTASLSNQPTAASEGPSSIVTTQTIFPTPGIQLMSSCLGSQTLLFPSSHTLNVGSSTSSQPLSFMLPVKSKQSVDMEPSPNIQSINASSSGCFMLPLQVLNSLPALRPGMSILLNVKNGVNSVHSAATPNATKQMTSACVASINNAATGQFNTSQEANNPFFIMPGSGMTVASAFNTNVPVIQFPNQQQRIALLTSPPSTLMSTQNPLLSSYNSSQTMLPNPGTSGPNDIKTNNLSSSISLPLGTQFFVLRPVSKPTIVGSFGQNVNSAPLPAPVNPIPHNASSGGLTVLFTNSNQKINSDANNLLLFPSALTKPNSIGQTAFFPISAASVNQNFSSTCPLITTSPWSRMSTTEAPTIPSVSLNSTESLSSVTTGLHRNSSHLITQSSIQSVSANSVSFPLTLLPNVTPQTVLLATSWPTVSNSSNSQISDNGNSVNQAFLSPVTTFSSSSLSSSSCVSFENSLPSPPLPGTHPMETSCSESLNSSPSILIPLVANTMTSQKKDTTANEDDGMQVDPTEASIESKKNIIVLPSADNLLSTTRANYSNLSVSTVLPQQVTKVSDSKSKRLHSPSYPKPTTYSTSTSSSASTAESISPLLQTNSTSVGSTTSRRRHQCPYCPKSCERKDNLQAHIRTHTGERPYPCRFCPKAFPQKDHLRAHIRTHTGEKPYRCPQCLKAFAQLGNLHRHLKTHRR